MMLSKDATERAAMCEMASSLPLHDGVGNTEHVVAREMMDAFGGQERCLLRFLRARQLW